MVLFGEKCRFEREKKIFRPPYSLQTIATSGNLFSLFWPVSEIFGTEIFTQHSPMQMGRLVINLLSFSIAFFLMRNDGMESSMKWNLWRFKSLSSIKLMFVYWNDEIFALEGLFVYERALHFVNASSLILCCNSGKWWENWMRKIVLTQPLNNKNHLKCISNCSLIQN